MQMQMPGGNGHLNDNLKLNEITYIGAHNCAMSKSYGWFYAQQNVTITEQFEKYGARHFKVPLHWYTQGSNSEIVVAHEPDGKSNCKLTMLQRVLKKPEKANIRLKEIVDLSFKNPNEIIILKIESKLLQNSDANGTKGWDPQLGGIMLHSLLHEIRADQRAIKIIQGEQIPTLGWCRKNQKNLLITIEPKEQIIGELTNYTYYSYLLSAQVDWEKDPLEDVANGDIARGKINQQTGYILSPFLEIHFCPENSFKPDSQYKKKYNAYNHVRKRFLQFYFNCLKMPNFLIADFVDQGGLSDIVDDINLIISSNGEFLPELFEVL